MEPLRAPSGVRLENWDTGDVVVGFGDVAEVLGSQVIKQIHIKHNIIYNHNKTYFFIVMPRNYQNGKIYTIRSRSRPDLIYVGSTIQSLSTRFGEHKKTIKYMYEQTNYSII